MKKEDYVWIDDKYNSMFEATDFTVFDDIFDGTFGQLIRKEPEKKICFFKISQFDPGLGFYVKQERPKFFTYVKYFLKNRRLYQLNMRHELALIRLYEKQNIPVVEPVAWGERKIFGVPVRGFLILREVAGSEFVRLVKDGCMKERKKLILAYGKLVAELHSKGLISTVARVTDLICTSSVDIPWDDITLVIIDREKGPLEPESYSVEKAGYALSSILVRFVFYINAPSKTEIRLFLQTYLEYLNVDSKPSFRDLFLTTKDSYKVMFKTYENYIGSDFHNELYF
jgi:hypothetical protein